MDLKKKLKSLISDIRDSTVKSPTEEDASLQSQTNLPSMRTGEHSSEYKLQDPRVDQELINNIDEAFLSYRDDFDVVEYQLQKMSEKLTLPAIEEERRCMKEQLHAVSHRVSDLVLENHAAYATELERVMDLERTLLDASAMCMASRRHLHGARQRFTSASLGLLRNYRKRQQLNALLKSLHTIKTLQQTDVRLRELLDEEDYTGAIQLCLECQKAASIYRHYTCIRELSSKLQDTLEMIDESMDVALSKICTSFDEEYYTRLQTAYKLLCKTQAAVDQLLMHFTSSVHNTAFVKVVGYVELCSTSGDVSFQKRQYNDLCKFIKPEVFLPCLIDLCKAMWELMNSYHKTIEWHRKNDPGTAESVIVSNGNTESGNDAAAAAVDERAEASNTSNSQSTSYIQQKLNSGLYRIWADVQQKIKVYLLSTDLSSFKYDEFIQVLDVINRLIQVGDEFCGSSGKSENLEESVRKQSLNYFRSYHRSRLDELRIFLENEVWELCPVKSNFNILMLQEFKFIRQSTAGQNTGSGRVARVNMIDSIGGGGPGQDASSSGVSFFTKYASQGSPFDFQTEEDDGEDVLELNGVSRGQGQTRDSDSDDDIPDELKADFVDEQTGEQPPVRKSITAARRRSYKSTTSNKMPIVTNTTLTVCRLFGRYMQMMLVLKPIAFDVTICMTQLFDYYLYAVYSFFASELENDQTLQAAGSENVINSKLRATLKRIRENLIYVDDGNTVTVSTAVAPTTTTASDGGVVTDDRLRVPHPHISPAVNLQQPDSLFGLVERIVATESLMFLTDQFKLLQQRLEDAIPPAKKAFLQQFFSQTLSTASELRRPVYRAVATRSVNFDNCLQLMVTNVKWDVKEIMSQHSAYVDVLLSEFQSFDEQLSAISKRVPIPKPVSNVLWEHLIRLACSTFVEGFASAKRCTNEGRALMQLDFQQFLNKLEKLIDLRPIPGRELVEVYIKAYYLTEAQFETWIYDHKEYSGRQLLALVNCLGHISKKSRQRLISVIEDRR